jgi:alpha/beta superfamily hydrolase
MKRDDVLFEPCALAQGSRVERRALFLDGASRPIFAWYHEAPAAAPRDCVAVVCPPVGSEYTRSHRSLRHLADRLAQAGIPCLRFDYDGTGDSPGGDLDPGRVEAWQASIRTAIGHARRLSGRARACLVGVRFGATLAALAAAETPVEHLVLWNPCVKGRGYVRELRAIALAAEDGDRSIEGAAEGAIESAGFMTSAETLAAMGAVDLLACAPRVSGRALVIHRDDLVADGALAAHLGALGIATDGARLPGWAGMMAEHQFTVVPEAAIATLVDWAAMHAGPALDSHGSGAQPVLREETSTVAVSSNVEEAICRFGEEGHLFGILSRPQSPSRHPAVVLCNAGAAHHVGPHRLYVTLARELAARGFPCLRFDLESLGDSVNRAPGRENYPYPRTATQDARRAVEHLRSLGHGRLVVMGLCSGAHTAFHAGLEIEDAAIEEIVLINPMQFHWVDGMSLDTSRRFEDMLQYRRSLRDPRRWLKLLRGDVNFRRMLELARSYPRTVARTYRDALWELLAPAGGPRLSRDLKRLFAMGRRVTLFVSEGDPGRDVLMAHAKVTATRALRSGRIHLERIPRADHTFSRWNARRKLLDRLLARLDRTA